MSAKPRFFNIEAKEFRIRIDDLSSGRSILITEKANTRFFHISLELGCVKWLINELRVLSTNIHTGAFRTFRGDSYQVWVERSTNPRGTHLRLSKCVNGTIRSVVIPSGRAADGWLRLQENLQMCLEGKEDRCDSIAEFGRGGSVRYAKHGKSYKEAVGTTPVERASTCNSTVPVKSCNWDWVVVCERQEVHQSWKDITVAIIDKIKKDVVLVPYQINRAYFSCLNENDASAVCSLGRVAVENQSEVLLFSWEASLKTNPPKIVSYGGWVGISGLPLHWWNNKFFERIAEECGGLVAVGHNTRNFRYLFEAKIKVRPNPTGFLPEILSLSEGTENYFVKIRPISSAIRPNHDGTGPPTDHSKSRSATEHVEIITQFPMRSRVFWNDNPPRVDPSRLNGSHRQQTAVPENGRSKEEASAIFGSVKMWNTHVGGNRGPDLELINVAGKEVTNPREFVTHGRTNRAGPSAKSAAQPKPLCPNALQPNLEVIPTDPSPQANSDEMGREVSRTCFKSNGGIATGTTNRLNFLSRFGRVTGHGSSGSRSLLPHADCYAPSAEAEARLADPGSASSICPDSVESSVPTPCSESDFVDERSSADLQPRIAAFDGEEGLFIDFFAEPAGPSEAARDPIEGSLPKVDGVDPEISADTQILYYTRKRRKRRDRDRPTGSSKPLLNKMDISLVPLKKNLTNKRNGRGTVFSGYPTQKGNEQSSGNKILLREYESH